MTAFGTFPATIEVLADLCDRYDRPRVLDIGCGDGRHLRALASRIGAGLGVDVSQDAVEAAARHAGALRHLAFRRLAAEQLTEGAPGRFDLVLFVGSLEHMADPGAALAAARSRMHAGGRLVVVAIAPAAPHAVISRLALRFTASPVVGHLGVEGVARLAGGAGLEVEAVEPLRRGDGRSRRLDRLLAVYDRIGGPTAAVVLRPDEGAPG